MAGGANGRFFGFGMPDVGIVAKLAVLSAAAETQKQKAQNIEFLSDNGPEYACRKLRKLLQDFGMVICRTPRRSPESNGLVEAFFGSFKRDYVYQKELPNLGAAARQIPEWIKDYNQVAPHSALGMKAPAEFYADWRSKISHTPVQI